MRTVVPATSRELTLRLCGGCGAALADPWPTQQEVAGFYSKEYAYYDPSGDDPDAEASSAKFTLARLRHLGLSGRSPITWMGEALAASAEVLSNKTISYSLGVPLALPRTTRMLDYGCGSGLWLRAMRRKGFLELNGYDISENADAKRFLAAEEIDLLDRAELDASRGLFGLVRLEHVFEHLVDPIGTLGLLRALLRPDGWLVMTFPSIHPWLGYADLSEPASRGHLQFPLHVVQHSMQSAREWLQASGLETVGMRLTRRERFITLAARPSPHSIPS